MEELNVFLKKLRKEKKVSLRQASRDIGISHTYLDSLEKGFDPRTNKERTPTPDVLTKIARYYDVPYIKLLNSVYNFDSLSHNNEINLINALSIEDDDEVSINKINNDITNGKIFTLDPDQRLSIEDSKTVASIMTKTAFLLYHGPEMWGTEPLLKEIVALIENVTKK